MDCRSFKELVPAFALDALDEDERAACAAHLAERGPHDGCRQAESDARAVAARLARALPERPVDPHLWRAIEERVKAKLAAQRAAADERPPARRRDPAGWGVAVLLLWLYLAQNPQWMAPSPTSRTFGFGSAPHARAAARVI